MRILTLLLLLPLTACLEEELAYTVEASPVKGEIVRLDDLADGTAVFEATFTNLDKEGILDQNVGIVATPVANLSLDIVDQEQQLLTTAVTDNEGRVTVELPPTNLDGVSRLEWVGTYDGRNFRILKNL